MNPLAPWVLFFTSCLLAQVVAAAVYHAEELHPLSTRDTTATLRLLDTEPGHEGGNATTGDPSEDQSEAGNAIADGEEERDSGEAGETGTEPEVTGQPTTTAPTTATPEPEGRAPVGWFQWRLACNKSPVSQWHILFLKFLDYDCVTELIPSELFTSPQTPELQPWTGQNGTRFISSCTGCDPLSAFVGGIFKERTQIGCVKYEQDVSPMVRCPEIVLQNHDGAQWNTRQIVQEGLADEDLMTTACVSTRKEDFPTLNCGHVDNRCGGHAKFGTCTSNEKCENLVCKCEKRMDPNNPEDQAYFAQKSCGLVDDKCGKKIQMPDCPPNHECITENETHFCVDPSRDLFKSKYWRLRCNEAKGRWNVREVQFHQDGMCRSDTYVYIDEMLDSGPKDQRYTSDNMIDGNTDSRWAASCFSCNKTLDPVWFGIQFKTPVVVECVYLLQSENTFERCKKIFLEYGSTDDITDPAFLWRKRYQFGYGLYDVPMIAKMSRGWDNRTDSIDFPLTLKTSNKWRVVCEVEMPVGWEVGEVKFFQDIDCTLSLEEGIIEYFSSNSDWPMENLHDNKVETLWRSSCGCRDLICKPCDPGEVRIGAEWNQAVIVNCVQLTQTNDNLKQCPTVSIQIGTDPDAQSMHLVDKDGIVWVEKETFDGVSQYDSLRTLTRKEKQAELEQKASTLSVGEGIKWTLAWLAGLQ